MEKWHRCEQARDAQGAVTAARSFSATAANACCGNSELYCALAHNEQTSRLGWSPARGTADRARDNGDQNSAR